MQPVHQAIVARGITFVALAAAVHVGTFWLAFRVVTLWAVPRDTDPPALPAEADRWSDLTSMLFLPSWLDVAVTLVVAAALSAIPSSRWRVLPVWCVCIALPVLRVWAIGLAIDTLAFGPGALPTHLASHALSMCMAPAGLTTFACVLAVGALAAARPAPRRGAS